MKKILFSSLVFAFAFVVSAPANADEVTASGEILAPEIGEVVNGVVELRANYFDGDDTDEDIAYWAVRTGSCGGSDVLNWKSGLSTEWDNANFSVRIDTAEIADGNYCFVWNPNSSADDIRDTRMFVVANAPAMPTGLQRLARENHDIVFECGDVAQIRPMHPDWDNNTETDLSHYEYTSFHPNGTIGLDEERMDESIFEYNGSWVPNDGTYGFAVRAVDNAGNKSEWALNDKTLDGSCQITYDSTAPVVPVLVSPADGAVETGGPTQVWSHSDPSDVDHYLYESYSNESLTNLTHSTDVNGTSRTIGGTQDIVIWWRIAAVDAVGNISGWTDAWKLIIDNTAPTVAITAPIDGDIYSGSIPLQATCNEECDYINFWWRAEGENYSNTSLEKNYHYERKNGTAFNWELNSMDAERWGGDPSYVMEDGDYYFKAAGKDVAGNWARTDEVKISINNTPDNKDECKKDGWKEWLNPEFKNQGECVSFLERNENAEKKPGKNK